jgi:hypothetical protein
MESVVMQKPINAENFIVINIRAWAVKRNSRVFQEIVTRILGFSRTLTIFKDFQGPGIFSHKMPGLSRFSRTCGDPVFNSLL